MNRTEAARLARRIWRLARAELWTIAFLLRSRSPNSTETWLYGRQLRVARWVWFAITAFTVGVFLASLPAYYETLRTMCAGPPCAFGQISLQTEHALRGLGISLDGYAAVNVAITILWSCVWFAVAGVLMWRRSSDLMILVTSLFLMVAGYFLILETLATSHSRWSIVAQVMGALYFILFSLVASLFPNGKFVPSWTRWLVVAYSVAIVIGVAYAPNPFVLPQWLRATMGLVLLGFACGFGYAQVHRYRHVSTRIERQQTKVIVFGLVVALGVSLGGFIPSLLVPDSLFTLIFRLLQYSALLLAPISFAVAILRYHLWDIDRVINMALVYGTLTVTLGALYVGLVVGLTNAAGRMTAGALQEPFALVIATLTIYVLVQPLRRRVQRLIDQRFYRERYDAARTLAAFRLAQRGKIELEQLRAELVAVVYQTMQPAHVSLWLREAARPPIEQSGAVERHQ